VVPKARRSGLELVPAREGPLLIDHDAGVQHELAPVVAAVWQLADGERTVAALAAAAEEQLGLTVTIEETWAALDALADAGALEERVAPPADGATLSRRRLLRTAVIATGAGAAAAVVAGAGRPPKQQEQAMKVVRREVEQTHKQRAKAPKAAEQKAKA
jgi:hypothetical protein